MHVFDDMSFPCEVHGARHRVPGSSGIARCAGSLLSSGAARRVERQLSTISCEVDYARGGGSSGATVRDEGARSAITRRVEGTTCVASSGRVPAATKPAAHEAKSWQFAEAGARSHGMVCEPRSAGAEASFPEFAAFLPVPVMSMPLIPAMSTSTRAPAAPPEGARHVTPAPASTSWKERVKAMRGEKSRVRIMVRWSRA